MCPVHFAFLICSKSILENNFSWTSRYLSYKCSKLSPFHYTKQKSELTPWNTEMTKSWKSELRQKKSAGAPKRKSSEKGRTTCRVRKSWTEVVFLESKQFGLREMTFALITGVSHFKRLSDSGAWWAAYMWRCWEQILYWLMSSFLSKNRTLFFRSWSPVSCIRFCHWKKEELALSISESPLLFVMVFSCIQSLRLAWIALCNMLFSH